MPSPATFHCPKCSRLLEKSGEIYSPAHDGAECPVFQCDNAACQVPWIVDGEEFPTAFTFAVGPDGRPFDPPTDDLL